MSEHLGDRYIRAGSVRARYLSAGVSGSTVILLHGLGDCAEIWKHNLGALGKRHRVVAPDLVGFGFTEKPASGYSVDLYVKFIDDFLRALKIEKAHIVGHSLGGGIALQYALTRPQKVDRLVLVSSAGFGPEATWPLRLATLPCLGAWIMHPNRRALAVFFRRLVYDPAVITGDFVDVRYRVLLPAESRRAVLKVIRSILNLGGARPEIIDPIRKNLGHIQAPTCIIWGTHDRILPLRHAHIAKEGIAHSELHIFEKCGHMPNFECPEKFNTLVMNFLAGT